MKKLKKKKKKNVSNNHIVNKELLHLPEELSKIINSTDHDLSELLKITRECFNRNPSKEQSPDSNGNDDLVKHTPNPTSLSDFLCYDSINKKDQSHDEKKEEGTPVLKKDKPEREIFVQELQSPVLFLKTSKTFNSLSNMKNSQLDNAIDFNEGEEEDLNDLLISNQLSNSIGDSFETNEPNVANINDDKKLYGSALDLVIQKKIPVPIEEINNLHDKKVPINKPLPIIHELPFEPIQKTTNNSDICNLPVTSSVKSSENLQNPVNSQIIIKLNQPQKNLNPSKPVSVIKAPKKLPINNIPQPPSNIDIPEPPPIIDEPNSSVISNVPKLVDTSNLNPPEISEQSSAINKTILINPIEEKKSQLLSKVIEVPNDREVSITPSFYNPRKSNCNFKYIFVDSHLAGNNMKSSNLNEKEMTPEIDSMSIYSHKQKEMERPNNNSVGNVNSIIT